ncbi:MAG TPA: CheR family methyltransferase [Pyrinomonadaceae bacterium]|jgi:two-component system CheB/CheR fusion protein
MSDSDNGSDLFGAEGEHRGAGSEFLIVGLGASAGGIHALKEFFAHVPARSGMAYVVILHLSPDHESKLAEVLQSTASMPVMQVRERIRVEPDHVYVISPNQSLSMNDGHLSHSELRNIEERRAPVDIFFRTLAESHHSRAVCVVLSGTGADGSMGMKRVKERGGICIVQEPGEAEYADMPRNSIATGLVDYVLPVGQIPAKIIGYKQHLDKIAIPVDPEARPESDDVALHDIFTQLRARTGHDFSNYKRSTLLRRIERRVRLHELSDLPAYGRLLRMLPDEAQALLKDLLISVTNFFRDPSAFLALERSIVHKLFEDKGEDGHVRVWVAGCATGEEAYSLAMLLSEYAPQTRAAPHLQVFATDIDEEAIAKAREGLYTLNDAADVSAERLHRFFVKEVKGYRVRREIREMVLFSTHNVIKDPPFSHLDLITCRNLLIYLNRAAQERVMQVFHFALNPGGFLFLGTSESVEGSSELFIPLDKENHIFQSRHVAARPPVPVPGLSLATRNASPSPPVARSAPEASAQEERLSYYDLHQRLLEQYAPPSIVVNEEYDVVHLSERAGRYLQVAGGEPSHNLFKLVRPELRLELRTALYQAAQRRTNIEAQGLRVVLDDGQASVVNLSIRPVLREEDATRGFILIVFEETGEARGAEVERVEVAGHADLYARQLEEELIHLKSQLRATVEQQELQQEEFKASNEELQAINEELRSATEELETSKEELQSVNEELTTVNQELKIKIEELSQSNNDFQNLMNSTDIGTIFLDRALRIKLFTPAARNIFNLIPNDVGRPLSDITGHLNNGALIEDVARVLDKLQPIEREIGTHEGGWYLMHMLPYRTAEDRISGVVVTFLDITERRLAEEKIQKAHERFRLAEAASNGFIYDWEIARDILTRSDGLSRVLGYGLEDIAVKSAGWVELIHPEDRPRVENEAHRMLAGNSNHYAVEYRVRHQEGQYVNVLDKGLAMRDEQGHVRRIVGSIIDITERKQADEVLRLAHEELERRVRERTSKLAATNEALRQEATERRHAEDTRAHLLGQLVTAQEDERRRIARDLHDQMGQQLTALRLKLETLKHRIGDNREASAQVEQAQSIAHQIEADVDYLARQLRPAALDDIGLKDTLADYVKSWASHFDIPAEFHASGFDGHRLLPDIETNLYRIAQEALNNVSKPAQAARVDVILERRDSNVVLVVEDDGGGFDPEAKADDASRGMGLAGIRERAALIGGAVEFESAPGEGTTVFVRAPAVLVAPEGEA